MESKDWAAFGLIAWPLLTGLLAIGSVLLIKIARRRQATRDGQSATVPALPLSSEDARRMLRRYLWGAALALLVLVLGAAWMLSAIP